MSKSNDFENDLLQLIFNAIGIANLADDAESAPITDLYVSLHTASPNEGGDQETNECAYGDYARVAVPRDNTGWIVSNNSVSPAATIEFPEATGGSETATHFAIGTDVTGGGKVLYYGTITPNISISTGVTPRLTTASTVTED